MVGYFSPERCTHDPDGFSQLNAFKETFDLIPANELKVKIIGAEGLVAFKKGTSSLPDAVPLFSFVPPTVGVIFSPGFLPLTPLTGRNVRLD